ncbi:MAG: methionine ABC transporter ATP-binding protein, partial [Gammaproteobacteria bacterium]|nr:methionine ABC transporter ATP-binding protein [Gammaproteobacteria bacterium]
GCAFRTRCPRATDVCMEEPPLSTHGQDRSARCFHPHV